MALVIKDRVKETTTSTGTGSITLAGAEEKYIAFGSVLSNSDTVYYAIEHSGSGVDEWEVGIGTYTSSTDSISRDTILSSSNSGSAVNFSVGTKTVFATYPADKAIYEDASGNVDVSGNITVGGTVDGRDLATDGTKLDAIESGATADQTAAEIKTAYESNSDTNAFTDSEKTKLSGIETGATADQSASEIKTAYESNANTNAYTDSEKTKLAGIETGADVTDTTNVTAAGALMDSEVTNLAQVKAFDSSDYATAAQGTTADNALARSGGTMTGAITFAAGQTFDGRDVSADGTKLDGIESGATADQTAAEIRALVESATNSNVFTDADHTKLNGIETGATADQTASEILTAIKTVDGAASGLDADLLDGNHASAFATSAQGALADSAVQPSDNVSTLTNDSGYITGNQTITLSGDVSGSGTTSIIVTVADDSHNHVISNIDGLQTALDNKLDDTQKGAANGLAELDSSGKVPSSQLPSYVDDVLEYSSSASFPATGETGKLYVDLTTNDVHRWTGSTYVKVSDAVSTADQAAQLSTARTISLTGDVSGSTSFDGSSNVSITATVADDSHNHIISNVDGLQTALDAKADDSTTITAGSGLTGGGSLGADRTINVGAGTGVTVNANDVAIGQDVATTANVTFNNITVTGTVDGRDVATDGTKLDGIESGATADQTAQEIATAIDADTTAETTLKSALGLGSAAYTDSTDYATAAQGALADSAIQPNDSPSFGSITVTGTVDGRDVATDGTKLDGISSGAEVNQNAFSNVAVSGQTTVAADGKTDTLNLAAGSNVTITTDATTDTVTIASTDTNTVPNDATITITAGDALSGGGNFTTDQSSNETITINHADTSTQTSVNNSGRTYIQDITLDDYGHVTGLTSATETVTDTNQLTTFVVEDGDGTEVTISHGKEWKFVEGTSIDINWTDTSTGSDLDPYDLTISHADTSTLSGTYGSGSNSVKIDTITVDAQGHVTGITTGLTGDILGVTAGTGIAGGGTSGTVTISHANTSSQASVNNSGRSYIQDITLDEFGHVTGITSATETVEYFAGSGITLVDDVFTVFAGSGLTQDTSGLSHADTSTQSSVDNSNGTVIQDVTLDGFGHVTGLASVDLDGRYYTETEADSRFVNVTGDTLTGNLTVPTLNVNTSIDFGDWTITESGGSLYFATGGTNKMKLDASGNLDIVGNVNSNATIT